MDYLKPPPIESKYVNLGILNHLFKQLQTLFLPIALLDGQQSYQLDRSYAFEVLSIFLLRCHFFLD